MIADIQSVRLTGDILGHWARAAPDRVAVIAGAEELSYATLDRRANRLAHGLLDLDMEPGARLVVMSANRAEVPVIHFGAARTGHIAVHVSARYTAGDLAYVLDRTGAEVLLADSGGLESYAQIGGDLKVIGLGADIPSHVTGFERFLEGQPARPPGISISPDDAFCITYTGGTSGRPKGAIASHAARLVSARSGVEDFGLRDSDIIIVTTPLCHAAGLFSWYQSAALAGATAVLMAKWDTSAFIDMVERHRATGAFVVPTQLAMLLDDPGVSAERLRSLRMLVFGGAPAGRELIERAEAALPDTAMIRAYGSTETGHLLCQHPEDRAINPDCLGRSGRHFEVAVLDAAGARAGPGEAGEIASRGSHAMIGYWGEPEQTARYFRAGGGWGLTGDLGAVDRDGYITLKGRSSDVIISGGMNIYPAEIEQILAVHPAVAECAVVGVPDAKWGEVPAAAVILVPDASVSAKQLIDYCAGKIANFKRPREVVFVDALPKTSAGKLRRGELKAQLAKIMKTEGD